MSRSLRADRKICAATRQTVFMITHDVDEAILLADKATAFKIPSDLFDMPMLTRLLLFSSFRF